MAIDPTEIDLTPEQKRQLADLAEQTGRPWPEVLFDALSAYRPHRDKNGRREAEREAKQSLAAALAEDGLLGSIKDAPADLSTNPKYMAGFGREHEPSAD